jgi:hypothetical protein
VTFDKDVMTSLRYIDRSSACYPSIPRTGK